MRELVALLETDPVVAMLTRLARERSGGDAVARGASVELPIASFHALYLHFGALTRVVAVPGVGAIAVVDGREVYRARGDAVVLHRAASTRVRDAACRECLAWTELAVLWSIRAVRDGAAGTVAAGLGIAAARHCLVAAVR
ncbi:MAG TPA: hypothetical protein VFM93_11970 [Candidatus Limnocylindria bacterium]|nr:hypothetical protein [Candidatus Limnocylindria bacterium]